MNDSIILAIACRLFANFILLAYENDARAYRFSGEVGDQGEKT